MIFGVRYAVAGAIGGYQRWISPYKGFHCAHWTLHHGESCSAHGKRLVVEEGVMGFFRGMRRRLSECRQAALALRAQRDLLICLASHASPVVDGDAGEDAGEGEGEGEGKDAAPKKRGGSGWWWSDCAALPDCDFIPSCDFDLPSCDCSW